MARNRELIRVLLPVVGGLQGGRPPASAPLLPRCGTPSSPVLLPCVTPIPSSSSWTSIRKNFRGKEQPVLTHIPYFGDEVNANILEEVYTIRWVSNPVGHPMGPPSLPHPSRFTLDNSPPPLPARHHSIAISLCCALGHLSGCALRAAQHPEGFGSRQSCRRRCLLLGLWRLRPAAEGPRHLRSMQGFLQRANPGPPCVPRPRYSTCKRLRAQLPR